MKAKGNIEQALDHCKSLFVISPRWLVLSTMIGEYLGHVILPEENIEIERITALSAGASGHYERHAMEYRLGEARCGLIVAETGCVVYAFVGEERVLSLMFKDTTLTALTSILSDMPGVIEYLVQFET